MREVSAMAFDGVKRAAIIGPGITGSSLAVLFSGNGIKTVLLAPDEKELAAGKARVDAHFGDLMREGLLKEREVKACEKLLSFTCDYRDTADADFVFECVYERMDVKHSVYRLAEQNFAFAKVFASATSSFSPDSLSVGFTDRTRFLVAHPWNPPHLVPCVEVVGGRETSKEAIDLTMELMKYLGREPVLMKKNAAGFIGNRLQHALFREALSMVEQGAASPEDIDRVVLTSFGPRYSSIGIFEHMDYVGLDTIRNVDNNIFPTLCSADKAQAPVLEHIKNGELGFKTGKGMLDWTGKDRDEFRRRAGKPYLRPLGWKLPEE
jgi:3-hydroxybutyryl-CoA dehydrogenase